MSIQRHHPDAEIRIGGKTYAETKGEQPFDWNRALANPPEPYSTDHAALMNRSRSWVTCACGNQCAILPRYSFQERRLTRAPEHFYEEGTPRDAELMELGGQFHGAIISAAWTEAQRTLAAIERRSAQLIAELTLPANP